MDATDIRWEVVRQEPLVAALPEQSPLAARDTVSMQDLAGEALVGYPENSSVAQTARHGFTQAGVEPRYAQRVSETSTLLSLVAAGIGCAVVPESVAALSLDGCVFRPLDDPPTVDLAVAWRDDETAPGVLRFRQFLRQVITGPVG